MKPTCQGMGCKNNLPMTEEYYEERGNMCVECCNKASRMLQQRIVERKEEMGIMELDDA